MSEVAKKSPPTLLFGLLAIAGIAAPVIYLQMPPPGAPSNVPCISSIKQLTIANSVYLEDNNNRMPGEGDLSVKLAPYVKNPAMFACSETKMPFTLNSLLYSIETTKIEDPNKTVFLYEGENWQLSGPHKEFSAVAFLGGKVEMFRKTKPPAFEVRIKQKNPPPPEDE